MRPLFWMLILAVIGSGLVGCGGPDEPRKDAEGKTVKAPDVPPGGP